MAVYGHCPTKGLGTFLGFRVHLLISYEGIPLGYAIANADIDDRDVLWVMSATGDYRLIIGDKGYVSEPLNDALLEIDGVTLLAVRRENQKRQYTPQLKRCISRVRKRVETTINQLEDQFNLCRVRARNHWGVLTRVIDKLSGFSLGAFLNSCLGRPLVALKDLVFA